MTGRSIDAPKQTKFPAANCEHQAVRHNRFHAETDPAVVRRLIAENPWSTLVSQGGDELIASHYPVLLDEASDDLAVVTHVGRPDEKLHKFGTGEMLLIVAGAHGYISPSWYSEQGTPVPTWNFSVAHCYGVPEVLDADENLEVLTRLVEHFERHVEEPLLLDQEFGAQALEGHGWDPAADHPLRLQGEDEPRQGPAVPAAGARRAPAPRALSQRRARRRHAAGAGRRRQRPLAV